MAGKKTAKAKVTKDAYKVVKKRSGRLSVVDRKTNKYVNGAEKVKILVDKGLLKVKLPAAKPAEGEANA